MIINDYLELAAAQAQLAYTAGEIPIGAVLVQHNKVIGAGFNQTIQQNNIIYHAEIVAIMQAQQHLNNFRLLDCELYVTVEPCLMCSGAIINSRIARLIFGAQEHKSGAVVSNYNVFNNNCINHHCTIVGPVNHEHYIQQLQQFFSAKRAGRRS